MKPKTLPLKTITSELYFLKKTVIIQQNIRKKDLQLVATKFTEKLLDPRNDKEDYQSFIRKKSAKSVKQSKIITHEPKAFKNLNIFDVKSVIIEHPKS